MVPTDGLPSVNQSSLLNDYFSAGTLTFVPADGFVTDSPVDTVLEVEVVSLEAADEEGVGLAYANNVTDGTENDPDTKREVALTSITVTVEVNSASPSAGPSAGPSLVPSVEPSGAPSLYPFLILVRRQLYGCRRSGHDNWW